MVMFSFKSSYQQFSGSGDIINSINISGSVNKVIYTLFFRELLTLSVPKIKL